MQNEGATKGILVTTSGYGKSSYAFADGKPLELLSGTHLLYLLSEHAGLEARIEPPDDWQDPGPDVEEASARALTHRACARRVVGGEPGRTVRPPRCSGGTPCGGLAVKLSTIVEAAGISKGYASQVQAEKWAPHVST
jgi:hypothetical protein